jgi:hypothetical protein
MSPAMAWPEQECIASSLAAGQWRCSMGRIGVSSVALLVPGTGQWAERPKLLAMIDGELESLQHRARRCRPSNRDCTVVGRTWPETYGEDDDDLVTGGPVSRAEEKVVDVTAGVKRDHSSITHNDRQPV